MAAGPLCGIFILHTEARGGCLEPARLPASPPAAGRLQALGISPAMAASPLGAHMGTSGDVRRGEAQRGCRCLVEGCPFCLNGSLRAQPSLHRWTWTFGSASISFLGVL